jgi:hypothetical protein
MMKVYLIAENQTMRSRVLRGARDARGQQNGPGSSPCGPQGNVHGIRGGDPGPSRPEAGQRVGWVSELRAER